LMIDMKLVSISTAAGVTLNQTVAKSISILARTGDMMASTAGGFGYLPKAFLKTTQIFSDLRSSNLSWANS